jgi:plastocyanin
VVLRRAALLAALVSVGPAAPGARQASIRGVVEVRLDLRAPAPRPSVNEVGAPTAPGVPDRRRSVVYFETAPQGAFEDHERAGAAMNQENESFVPYVLPVMVGTTVEFPNRDRTFHNVFSLSKTQRFDLGRYATGRSKSVRFDHPGVVRVFCDIHSHMNAFILVFAHRFFAATDESGAYRIDNVPPGTYNLVVWTDGRVRATRGVHVGEDGGVVNQDFVVE